VCVSGMLDDLHNEWCVAIDKQIPRPALTIQQVCQQFAVVICQRHGVNSL
jgi:hypothetical protein